MHVVDLFSGVGGFSIGLERSGMKTISFCEINKFARKILKKHWPEVPIHEDIRSLSGKSISADVVCGGFPCQDISFAGNQEGIDAGRSGLWREMLRIISEIRPRYAVVENVSNLLSGDDGRWFGRILRDLAQIGYDAEWHCISAAGVCANHNRDRVWIIAYPVRSEWPDAINTKRLLYEGQNFDIFQQEIKHKRDCLFSGFSVVSRGRSIKSAICGGDDGFRSSMDRIRAIGNAVFPDIPEIIGAIIMANEGHIYENGSHESSSIAQV